MAFDNLLHTTSYKRVHEDDLHLVKMYELLSPESGEEILDIGTGNGYVAFHGARNYQDAKYTGIDIAKQSIQKNNEIAKSQAYDNIKFDSYEGVALPYKGMTFDKIVSRIAFHHFEDGVESIRQMNRVLVDNGTVLLSDAISYEEDDEQFINRFQRLKKDGHVKFYESEELKSMFEANGFEFEAEFATKITYSRRYNEHYIRLIKETSCDILSQYNVEFMNDRVFVTVTIMNMKFKKIEERG